MINLDDLIAKARELVDAVNYDESGTQVGLVYMGGNGGMLSRETLKIADELSVILDAFEEVEV
jgi:hypothetical protein